MAKRGPPPKLKLVGGRAGGRGPAFAMGEPSRPEWLAGEALAEWGRIVPELQAAGVLAVVDRAALAAYCQAWAELVVTTRAVEAEGRTIEEPIQSATGNIVGHKVKAHPAVRLQRDAFARVKQFLVEFGLSPASRLRMAGDRAVAEAGKDSQLGGIRKRVQAAREAAAEEA